MIIQDSTVGTTDPTSKQQQASDPKASVWVNASAGSGKTTVLTNRVVRLLLDGVAPERILCLTFTRAAAAEMSIRITRKLSGWATCHDDVLRDDLFGLQGHHPSPKQLLHARRLFAHVLSCPGGMRIRTLHAFCQEILHRFPLEAGVPPHFSVLEEADATTLQDRALKHLLHRAALNPDQPLAKALRFLVQDHGEAPFMGAMRDLLKERARLEEALQSDQGKIQGIDYLSACLREELGLTPDDTTLALQQQTVSFASLPETDIRQLGLWLAEGSKKFAARGQSLLAWLLLPADQRLLRFQEYVRLFLKDEGAPYSAIANKEQLQKHPSLQVIFDREAARLVQVQDRLEAIGIAETTEALLVFGRELIAGYEASKRAQAVLDYDDLILRTHQLLRRPGIAPWVLFKLDGGLEHILVDEAQDTSYAQWHIVSTLAEEFFSGDTARSQHRTLFVVGDEKQSIFSFQRADPEAFLSMRRYFSERIQNVGKIYRELPLRVSFRSAPALLKAVDKVFENDNVRTGVSVEPVIHQAFVKPHAPKRGRVEVWPLLPKPEKEAEEEADLWSLPLGYDTERDAQAELAQQIACKINELLHNPEQQGLFSKIKPNDIMVLLRRRGRFADLMVRALKEKNIPVTGVDRMHLIRQLPVMDLLALIQFVLLPEDDLNLATVLRGPLLNISEDQLMILAMGRSTSLWHRLAVLAEDDLSYTPAYVFLAAWLNEADFITPYGMLAQLLNEPCPGSSISGRHALWSRLGTDALDPVEELLNAAQNFSHRHTPSLQSFLHWLMATEAEIKREQDAGSGQVRIMTVHASKGLEAPIVFLPDTASVPVARDVPRFQWNDQEIPLYLMRRPKAGTARACWEKARRQQLEEYRRLLYVALTRAASCLYICGWEPNRNSSNQDESWYNIVSNALEPLHDPSSVYAGHTPQPTLAFMDPILDRVPKSAEGPVVSLPVQLMPAWVRTMPVIEKNMPRYVVPSRLVETTATATPDRAFSRGRLIHRLLQKLPDVEVLNRPMIAARFLANPQHNLTKDEQDNIQNEVLGLLSNPEYAPLFEAPSQAEVPMVGRLGGQLISGQVDRLCVRGKDIWIVDYKTNRPPPLVIDNVPVAYRHQMASYHALLQDIYPDKQIRCFLLWTYAPRLMELPLSFMQQLPTEVPEL